MGFLEETLDKDSLERTFKFLDGDKEIEYKVSLGDLELIFKGIRPDYIPKEYFKEISKLIKKELKNYRKGNMVHLSKVTDEVWKEYGTKGKKQRGFTYRKSDDKK